MAKVKCEYCGNYIEDTLENCDVCGAVNDNHHRVASNTPQTIEELKSWYVARKLPPEETTRFFIGKNIKEPKAFGIYEENNQFIVYKNKANGQRAIRYKGTDEAYAVNELYLRLKEEILHQKNRNLNNKQRSIGNNFNSTYKADLKRYRKRNKSLISAIIVAPIISIVFMISCFVSIFIMASDIFNLNVLNDYYYSDTQTLYYQMTSDVDNDNADWWIYNKDTDEWSLFKQNVDIDYRPEDMTDVHIRNDISALAQEINEDAHNLVIHNSKTFIDAGHHSTPTNSYYYYNNNLYYFLNDAHGGISNDTGWYIYNDNEWEYYCDEDDKDKLGDDLWYSDSEYSVGSDITNIYTYNDSLSKDWVPSDFEDTSWYKSYELNEREYERKQEEQRENNWDNDNDYDWDDDFDWDSGGTDWDSDW